MFPEIQSIRYPFAEASSDSVQTSFMRGVKAVQIWVYSKRPLTAKVTAFSPAGLEFAVQQLGGETLTASCNAAGVFIDNPKIDTVNSFVEFSGTVNSSAYCQLQLLPQVLRQVPQGLYLTICSHKVQQYATSLSSDSGQAFNWTPDTINIVSGYNFQPSSGQGIVLAAGAGLGKGSPASQDMRKLLFDDIFYPNDYYDGLRSINGLTDDVSIQTTGSRYLRTNSIDKVTTMTIKNIQEVSDATSP